jgi:hypothetical protein
MAGVPGQAEMLAFLQTVDSFSSGRGVVFALDFVDPLVGLLGPEFRVTVAVAQLGAFAHRVGLLADQAAKSVIFHELNLTNYYTLKLNDLSTVLLGS